MSAGPRLSTPPVCRPYQLIDKLLLTRQTNPPRFLTLTPCADRLDVGRLCGPRGDASAAIQSGVAAVAGAFGKRRRSGGEQIILCKYEACARSSAGQSGGFLNRRSWVRVPPGVVDDAVMNSGDGQCRETLEAPKTQGEAASGTGRSSAPQGTAQVKAGDCGSTANGRSSDKLDDKPAITDPDLGRLVDAWPDLPEAIRAAITAMVEAATPKGKIARKE